MRLAEAGEISGRVLDAGCGTGTLACYLAGRGHSVVGIDASSRAIEIAREKVRERDLDVTVRVADALALDPGLGPFDTVVDSGLFHAFETDDRATYAESLAGVLEPGGRAFVLSFGADAPDDWGPNPVVPGDIVTAFDGGWHVRGMRAEPFQTRTATVPGLLAVIERA